MEEFGNIRVGGKTYLDELINAPAGTILMIGCTGIVCAFVIILRRLRG